MIALIPFFIELPADHILIKRKKNDLSWKVRVAMIAAVCAVCWWTQAPGLSWEAVRVVGRTVCLAICPYCFFDIALNLLRFGWKEWKKGKWAYVSSTNGKYFDRQFAKLNHWMLLGLRCLGFGLCILGWKLI